MADLDCTGVLRRRPRARPPRRCRRAAARTPGTPGSRSRTPRQGRQRADPALRPADRRVSIGSLRFMGPLQGPAFYEARSEKPCQVAFQRLKQVSQCTCLPNAQRMPQRGPAGWLSMATSAGVSKWSYHSRVWHGTPASPARVPDAGCCAEAAVAARRSLPRQPLRPSPQYQHLCIETSSSGRLRRKVCKRRCHAAVACKAASNHADQQCGVPQSASCQKRTGHCTDGHKSSHALHQYWKSAHPEGARRRGRRGTAARTSPGSAGAASSAAASAAAPRTRPASGCGSRSARSPRRCGPAGATRSSGSPANQNAVG